MDRTELTARLGATVMEITDHLADMIENLDFTDIDIGITGVAVEIKGTQTDGSVGTGVLAQCSDPRNWIQAAFFKCAAGDIPER